MKLSNIKFKNYKSFKENWVRVDNISNVNILIGRNNSGKSSVLDVIEGLTNANVFHNNSLLNTSYEVKIEHILTRQEVSDYLKSQNYGNSAYYIQQLTGLKKIYFIGVENSSVITRPHDFRHTYTEITNSTTSVSPFSVNISSVAINPYQQYKFLKLSADRDITPEKGSTPPILAQNGNGATSIIKTFLLDGDYDENIIENNLLSALNTILASDSMYEKIKIQKIQYGTDEPNEENKKRWEIFLEEQGKRYPLSKMGSGLKTIILVLINLLVLPEMKEYKDSKIIFAFEELENNLHPALQRRLFDYLYQYSIEKDVPIFLTTHSHVAINLFSNHDEVQIFHVKKENGISTMDPVEDYFGKSSLLEDLDVKASDILQSNGIIWVEGPSDRVYVKNWIDIYSDSKFKEGNDYQFLYYGGRLLSHYSTDTEEDELINILTTNRHAAIIIDSDKRSPQARINATKKRIEKEFKEKSLFCWITQGKEIENYLKAESISKALAKEVKQCQQYELFPVYIEPKYKNFESRKVPFARSMLNGITSKDDIAGILDLERQIKKLVQCIEDWNKA